jgi:DNA ligase-1
MTERDMTLLQDWQGQSVVGMLASEKLDGCRAYWDGQTLWTRGGKVIALPRITSQLPKGVHLDGEVWAGRGGFSTARVAVQFGKDAPSVRFVAFDAPQAVGTWTQRMDAAKAVWSDCVDYWSVDCVDALAARLAEIQSSGGEGIVLRKQSIANYEKGRTFNALKVFNVGR